MGEPADAQRLQDPRPVMLEVLTNPNANISQAPDHRDQPGHQIPANSG